MIAHLRGVLAASAESSCVIDVNGVGYLVFCSSRTLASLPQGTVTLLTEMQVREDAITLYGFATPAERDWFSLLTTVQGVGAKVALAILSALSPDQLIAAISAGDKAALSRAQGVGPKLAIRLVTELREKAGAMPGGGAAALPAPVAAKGAVNDALSALTNLGYKRAEAEAALAKAVETHGESASLDQLIRAGLKALAK
ncbi:Holliday junction branch migration protein RuvA [Acidocella sp.]|jgi:Holliday junction DNA helicase RuvA|uniref:Holliday junction branch migration protein RuvA n=1 Tax=Acidocella sp. TaxID=50710 RepID=UPI00260DCA59|nr:Holliday junction branch migration protein RuvA [Acidocella sp.]